MINSENNFNKIIMMKRSDCCYCLTLIISSVIFALGCLLYFPIEYEIYYSFFDHDWKSAKCMINSLQRYQILMSVDDDGVSYYTSYTLFDVRVNINGKWLQGFACGSPDATTSSAVTVLNQEYPYKYSICQSDKECGNMLMMPVWFCNECKNCQKEFNDETRNCKWFLKNGNNAINDVDEIPVGYKLDYPTQHSTFIQVIFMDSPYYYETDYLALQYICLYLMIYVPSGFITLSLFYFIINRIRRKC
ncbi:unnamed protein product [Blepharisma stoltei]|uniref:Uncharacterized protein n=1 Tax=Blepharisma stoltei TaxID=1481888 RepID=A0AAU9K5Y7_9CILI|nr:unnamed protein product [Blepharisma stoltei]